MTRMLAAEQFYRSDTFWTAIGAAVAVVTLLISVRLWFLGSPRRVLIYGLTSQTALLSRDARTRVGIGKKLQILLDGQDLIDPHVVSVAILIRGRRDIRTTDFEEGSPLVLDLAAPIVQVLDSDTGGPEMPKVPLSIDGTGITIGPSLINRRQLITLDLLTDGAVSLRCDNPPLADVTVRKATMEELEGQRFRLGFLWWGILVLPALYFGPRLSQSSGGKEASDIIASALIYTWLILIAYAVTVNRRGRRSRRNR